jgi:hypothetical protein
MVKKIQYFIVLTLLLVMVTSFTLDGRKAVGTLRTIVIDPVMEERIRAVMESHTTKKPLRWQLL